MNPQGSYYYFIYKFSDISLLDRYAPQTTLSFDPNQQNQTDTSSPTPHHKKQSHVVCKNTILLIQLQNIMIIIKYQVTYTFPLLLLLLCTLFKLHF